MLAMDVSISSTSTCLLPATFLWGLYVQKYQDTSLKALHWSTTSRQALVIDSIFLRVSLPAKFYYFDIVSNYKFLYLSLSTPLSRLWGKSCTLSPASFSTICGWNVHISFCWTEGARTFILLTSPQFDSGKVLLQFSRYFTVNSTFETMGDVLHILSNFAFSYMQLECTFFFCWTYVPVQFSQATLLPFLAAKARGGRQRRAGRPRSLLRVTHLLLWHSAPKRETSGHEPCCASRGLTPF